jgi:hypothetical protein
MPLSYLIVPMAEITEATERAVQIELQFLPCLEYFACLLNHDVVWIDVEERYRKQTYRNRCDVLTANKIDTLTVPVKSYDPGCLTKNIEIDYSQDWIRRHLGCLRSAYGKSPYYEFYMHEIEAVYLKKHKLLVDLNYDLLTICLRLVGVKVKIQYILSGPLRCDINLRGAMSLINSKKAPNIYQFYKPVPYYQTFGNDFVGNLSILDLIFNMGPESRGILTRSMIRSDAS